MYLEDIEVFLCDNSNYLVDLYNGDLFLLDDKETFLSIYKSNNFLNKDEEEMYNFIKANRERKNNYNINILDIDTIRINISNACNLACKYCYANGGNYTKPNSLMSKKVAKDIVTFIKNNLNHIETIFFFGGEPLLNIDIIEYICSEFKDKKFKLITNGTLINDKILYVLKEYSISVGLSLDGPSDIHNNSRITKEGEPTFEIIMDNIQKLKDNNIDIINVQGTYTDFTSNHMSKDDLVQYFDKNFKFKFLTISNDVNNKNSIYTENENYVINSIMNEKNVLLGLTINAILNSKSNYINNDFKCGAANRSMLIYSDGSIYPCQRFISEKESRLSNIYNFNKKELLLNRNIFNKKYLNIEKCSKCVAKFTCNICLADKAEANESLCKTIREKCEEIYNNLPNYLLDDSLMEHYENIMVQEDV